MSEATMVQYLDNTANSSAKLAKDEKEESGTGTKTWLLIHTSYMLIQGQRTQHCGNAR